MMGRLEVHLPKYLLTSRSSSQRVSSEDCRSTSRSEVVGLSDTCDITLFQHVQQVRVTDLTLLGAPLGEQAMTTIHLKRISELTTMGSRLEWISAHHALYLLRNCFSLPKLLYILRTSPCFDHPLVQPFNDLQIQLLQKLLNIKLDDQAASQATLPVRFEGLGVISVVKVAPSAYISSKLSCECLKASLVCIPPPPALAPMSIPPPTIDSDLNRVISLWKSSTASEDQLTSMHQRDWTSPVFHKVQICSSAQPWMLRTKPGFWQLRRRRQDRGWKLYQFHHLVCTSVTVN